MRNQIVVLAIVAFASIACGNYSNDDIAFLDALPDQQALQVSVPQNGSALGQQASLYTQTVATSQDIDAHVTQLIGLIDLIRTLPPTSRRTDGRTWGPFDDQTPGFEDQVTITRSGDTFVYALQQRKKGTTDFVDVLTGTFVGASAIDGHGTLGYAAAGLESIGHPPDDPNLRSLSFVYANDATPRSVNTTIVGRSPDGGTAELSYVFTQSPAEDDLDWNYSGPTPDAGTFDLHVLSRFLPQGPGRAEARGTVSALVDAGFELRITQCWDGTFAERYYDAELGLVGADGGFVPPWPQGYLCEETEGAPCPAGVRADCPF